jgi:hypothetical protein
MASISRGFAPKYKNSVVKPLKDFVPETGNSWAKRTSCRNHLFQSELVTNQLKVCILSFTNKSEWPLAWIYRENTGQSISGFLPLGFDVVLWIMDIKEP